MRFLDRPMHTFVIVWMSFSSELSLFFPLNNHFLIRGLIKQIMYGYVVFRNYITYWHCKLYHVFLNIITKFVISAHCHDFRGNVTWCIYIRNTKCVKVVFVVPNPYIVRLIININKVVECFWERRTQTFMGTYRFSLAVVPQSDALIAPT